MPDEAPVESQPQEALPQKASKSPKKIIFLLLKVAFSVAALAYVVRRVIKKDGAEHIWERLGDISLGFWLLAVVMQLCAIAFAVSRWKLVLKGQGITAPLKFLVPSFLVGRFFGAFTPGGLGLDGWKLYDVSDRTGKVARASAVLGVEKILGQMGFAVVVLLGSLWALDLIGASGVLLLNGFFFVLVTAGITLLSKPELVRKIASFLPSQVQTRVQTLVDAVCAYHGKTGLLLKGFLLSVGVHAFNNMIYVCATFALGVELNPLIVFAGFSLAIMATLLPASINGLGLREATAVALFVSVGVSETDALLMSVVGVSAEYAVSAFGVIPFIRRKRKLDVGIVVEDPDREKAAHAAIEEVPESQWPKRLRGLTIGLGAGLLAGVLVGVTEATVIILSGGGRVALSVLSYGAVAYGLFLGIGGACFGLALAWSGRLMKRPAMKESDAYARITAVMVAFMALALGAFRIRRDVFQEELVWKSISGLGVLLACVVAAAVLYLVLSFGLRWLIARKPGNLMLRAWGSPAVLAVVVLGLASATLLSGNNAEANGNSRNGHVSEDAPNVLFVMVDTLRADHLPAYGYENGSTPNLDEFAGDAIRFERAYANASWTRPSFASFLTGRYPANHGVMSKDSALPDEVETLAESFSGNGYSTFGAVTNFNVTSYYNFQQGFDEYNYLEPDYVLGADDAAAKLLLMQVVRRVVEKWRVFEGVTQPGTAYQDAPQVNAQVTDFLDRRGNDAWMVFAAYMDPHDPYYEHPYNGRGYSRAANQHPDIEEAPALIPLYDGEITYWDEHFGALVADLRRRGLYDDTLIIVTSDHGEEFGDHGGFWHGTTLYDEQVHVPLFVKLPENRRGGTTVDHWVQSVDLMPTVLNELGMTVPDGVQGGSLFEGTNLVYAEESHEGNILESIRERRGTDEIKLITANQGNARGLEPVELYELLDDPGELRNVATESEAEVVRTVEVMMTEARRLREGAAVEVSVEIDEEAAERLRAIGYVPDGEEAGATEEGEPATETQPSGE